MNEKQLIQKIYYEKINITILYQREKRHGIPNGHTQILIKINFPDDEIICKTVSHKESKFLQEILPAYYLNLHQNIRTLLPKFFGFFCYSCKYINCIQFTFLIFFSR